MKKLIFFSVLFTLAQFLQAQAPQKMSYQSVIRDAEDNLVTETAVGIQISILEGSPEGTAVFVETHAPITNSNGLASLEIGSGVPVSGSIGSIDWGNGPHYIKSETDPDGGTNYTLSGTTELLSVPYALYAASAASDGDWTMSAESLTTTKSVGVGTDSPNSPLHVAGTSTNETAGFETSSSNSSLGFYAGDAKTGELGFGANLSLRLDTSSNGNINFLTENATRLSIANDGRTAVAKTLAIGTLAPSPFSLRVRNDPEETGTNEIARFVSTASDGNIVLAENNIVRGALRFIGGDFFMNAPSTDARLRFLANNVERMTINSQGRVGIGVSQPQSTLHVREGVDASLVNNGYLLLGELGDNNLVIDNNEIIARDAGQNERLFLNATGGPISFGNSNTTYKFEFSGASSNYVARFVNTSKGGSDGIIIQTGPDDDPDNSNNFIRFRDGDGDDIGSIRGGEGLQMAIVYTSDSRLKKNVEPVENALSVINKMEPVTYEFISKGSNRVSGFLAQDLQKVYPEVVSGDPDGNVEEDPMGIDYGMLTPLLTAAIKEQQELINLQAEKIEALEKVVAEKEGSLNTMKAQLESNTQVIKELQGLFNAEASK